LVGNLEEASVDPSAAGSVGTSEAPWVGPMAKELVGNLEEA